MERITIHFNIVGDGTVLVDEPIETATLKTTIETATTSTTTEEPSESGDWRKQQLAQEDGTRGEEDEYLDDGGAVDSSIFFEK